jgi:hypothetical protein
MHSLDQDVATTTTLRLTISATAEFFAGRVSPLDSRTLEPMGEDEQQRGLGKGAGNAWRPRIASVSTKNRPTVASRNSGISFHRERIRYRRRVATTEPAIGWLPSRHHAIATARGWSEEIPR